MRVMYQWGTSEISKILAKKSVISKILGQNFAMPKLLIGTFY